eukprot:190868_1
MGLVLLIVAVCITLCFGDLITNLPGQPPVSFKQYSGYIVLNESTNKSLFYWFQESQNSPSTDPVALWTNGGPGCSGMAGALIEQGAFRVQKNSTLAINPGAWNNVASMLFIEQPIGVGFSYSNDDKDYIVGDERAAEDMFDMILGFLDQFPQYKSNDFYMSSESYGGHYMPTTAKYIVDHNTDKAINFKGFFLGNPYTAPNESAIGAYGTYYGHQLLPKPLFDEWVSQCLSVNINTSLCHTLQQQMHQVIGNIFGSGVDWAKCLDAEDVWFMQKVIHETLGRPIPKWYQYDFDKSDYDPCQGDYMKTYLNRQDVQSALHAKPTNWSWCGGPLHYNYSWSKIPQQPNYQYLCDSNHNLKLTIYSGDDDTVCGTMGTQTWMHNMTQWKLTSDGAWRPWIFQGQTGGYKTKWKCGNQQTISLVTIHSAGHEVPWFKPMKAQYVFEQYLKGAYN